MLYGVLSQTNEHYKPKLWNEIHALYEGGYRVLEDAQKLGLIPQLPREPAVMYEQRLKAASYINYISRIVDYFTANLFTQELVVTPAADADKKDSPGDLPKVDDFYAEFAEDADRKETSFQDLMREVTSDALLYKRGLVAIDLPRPDAPVPASLADEEQFGLRRAYAYRVPIEQLIDWEYDNDDGTYALAVLHCTVCRRETLEGNRNEVVEEFRVWERLKDTGIVRCRLFRTPPRKADGAFKPEDDVPLVDELETSFKTVPLVELKLPHGLWAGNKLGCLAREHFRRRSGLNSAEDKSLFAMPIAKLGPEVGAAHGSIPSDAQQNPHRGEDPLAKFRAMGYMVIGTEDSVEFAEPTGACYDLVNTQLKELVDEMFRIVDQMAASVSNTSQALGRSGQSKAQDKGALEVVLGALGSKVRDAARRVYNVISGAREEDVVWTPHGLDKFELQDRTDIIAEAVQLDAIPIPSVTFKRLYKTKIAFAMLGNVPPETQEQIRKEIEEGVTAEVQLADTMRDRLMSPPEPDPNGPPGDQGGNQQQSGKPGQFGRPGIAKAQKGKKAPKQGPPKPGG